MPGLLSDCKEFFGSEDLYTVLGVEKSASDKQLKRGYHKLSLQVHPDRVGSEEKEESTKKFQILGRVYSILSDKDKRAVYDESGEVDDENDVTQDRDWYEYWRLLFAKVSVKDIKQFEDKYKGSDEELKDLREAYLEFKGNMDDIMDNVLCSSFEDEPRFRKIIQKWIKKGEVPDFKAFSKENKGKSKQRKARAEKEAAEADEARKELGLDGSDSLKAMILKRKESREQQANDFFSHLEQKYSKPPKKKSKK